MATIVFNNRFCGDIFSYFYFCVISLSACLILKRARVSLSLFLFLSLSVSLCACARVRSGVRPGGSLSKVNKKTEKKLLRLIFL